jgi:catechol 2,3-dioxygenase-like lactoylglutathione lyase family enzyme
MTSEGKSRPSALIDDTESEYTMARSTHTGTVGLFEMILEVADLAASERFYRHLLGLPLANRWDPAGDDGRAAVFLEIGPHAFLGLWPEESGGARAIAGGRGGTHVHFALLVEYGTLDARRAELVSAGVDILDDRDFGRGNRAFYVADPDGNIVELTERRTDWAGAPMAALPVVRG